MFKKIRQRYWYKRDRGKGGNFVLLIIVMIVAFISIVYVGTRSAIKSYYAYEERKAENNETEESRDNDVSGSEVSSEAVIATESSEDNYSNTEVQTEQTQNPVCEYEVDTSGMATFLGYMSDQAYETLIKLTEEKCRELGVNTAKKLDFQKTGATEFDIIGYFLVGNDKVCECEYNLKSDVVIIADTTYMESDIRDMEAAKKKAEADELKKEQEEAKEAAEEETEEDIEKDATKKKGKKKGKKKSASKKVDNTE